jgi:hypothetical protein
MRSDISVNTPGITKTDIGSLFVSEVNDSKRCGRLLNKICQHGSDQTCTIAVTVTLRAKLTMINGQLIDSKHGTTVLKTMAMNKEIENDKDTSNNMYRQRS